MGGLGLSCDMSLDSSKSVSVITLFTHQGVFGFCFAACDEVVVSAVQSEPQVSHGQSQIREWCYPVLLQKVGRFSAFYMLKPGLNPVSQMHFSET
jgi:hypothetical protein